jgi:hypothetical protein
MPQNPAGSHSERGQINAPACNILAIPGAVLSLPVGAPLKAPPRKLHLSSVRLFTSWRKCDGGVSAMARRPQPSRVPPTPLAVSVADKTTQTRSDQNIRICRWTLIFRTNSRALRPPPTRAAQPWTQRPPAQAERLTWVLSSRHRVAIPPDFDDNHAARKSADGGKSAMGGALLRTY